MNSEKRKSRGVRTPTSIVMFAMSVLQWRQIVLPAMDVDDAVGAEVGIESDGAGATAGGS